MKRKHKIYLGMTIFLLTIYIGLLAILSACQNTATAPRQSVPSKMPSGTRWSH